MLFNVQTKRASKAIILKISPDEIPQFEDFWEEIQEYSNIPLDEAAVIDTKTGFGGSYLDFQILSPMVIFIVTNIGGRIMPSSFNVINDHITKLVQEKKIKPLKTDEIEDITNIILEEVKRIK